MNEAEERELRRWAVDQSKVVCPPNASLSEMAEELYQYVAKGTVKKGK